MLKRLLGLSIPFGILLGGSALFAQDSDTPATPSTETTQAHWFRVERSDQTAGVLKVELSRDDNSWIFVETWILFERDREILIQGESRFAGEGEKIRPTSLSVTVSAGEETWLNGALRFTPKGVTESFRHWDGEKLADVVERKHPISEEPWVTPATLPFLGPEIANEGNDVAVVFPAMPRGLRGPVIGGTESHYLLTRKGKSIRVRGNRAIDGRTAELELVDGRCERIELSPSLKLVRSDRATCLSWHRKRGKGGDVLDENPAPPPPKPLDG
ncbi:MAG: hypothetical protein AAF488_12150 [Planctomycetota bacterium]